MAKKTRRPARFRAGHLKDNPAETLDRVLLSRERLAESELGRLGQAWRLWSACIALTADMLKGADQTYVSVLARESGVHPSKAGPLMERFDELGVLDWKAAPRGSHRISEIALPELINPPRWMTTPHPPSRVDDRAPHQPPRVDEGASSSTAQGALPNIDRETKLNGITRVPGPPDTTGTLEPPRVESLRAGGIGAPDRAERSEDWHAERLARPGDTRALDLCPKHGCPLGEDGRCWTCLDELYGRAPEAEPVSETILRFGEPEPSAVTDTEAWQMRHRRRRG